MKSSKRAYTMTLRAERAGETRARILESAARLYSAEEIGSFTLDEIARRSQTTVQTVLRAFGSKESLLLAALHRLADGGVTLRPTPPGDVAAAIEAIFDLYETMGDHLVQRLRDERRRPTLKPELDKGRANHRAWVETIFSPLARERDDPTGREILDGLTAATDVYVWTKLRRDMRLDRERAEAAVRRMALGLVKREDDDGEDSLAQLVGRRQPAA
jgi:AcrR family transcriptional regulator